MTNQPTTQHDSPATSLETKIRQNAAKIECAEYTLTLLSHPSNIARQNAYIASLKVERIALAVQFAALESGVMKDGGDV